MRTFGALFLYMMEDEASQVNGVVYIIDGKDLNFKQLRFWGVRDLSRIAKMWQVMYILTYYKSMLD